MNWVSFNSIEQDVNKQLWARPERSSATGSLLIVGGHQQEFFEIQKMFEYAKMAGPGKIHIALPDSLERLVPPEDYLSFHASTPAGSFGLESLRTIQTEARAATVVVLCGEFSQNSETTQLLTKLYTSTERIVAYGDSLLPVTYDPHIAQGSCLLLTLRDIQHLAKACKLPVTLSRQADASEIKEVLVSLQHELGAQLMFYRNALCFVATADSGLTLALPEKPPSLAELAAYVGTEWAQFPAQQAHIVIASAWQRLTQPSTS